ncbi:MAG: hypothetical protein ACOC88_00415 [Candidatus Bipolaricaulota bacterium]
MVPVEESEISQRIAAAAAAGDLPDLARMGVKRVSVFAADGLLDEAAVEEVMTSIGEADFRGGPLSMVVNPATGKYAALPFDGWIQAL